jgi:hypothetical protein
LEQIKNKVASRARLARRGGVIGAAIRAAGLHIKDISTEDPDLEDVFVSLTYAAEPVEA